MGPSGSLPAGAAIGTGEENNEIHKGEKTMKDGRRWKNWKEREKGRGRERSECEKN